jgi:hypothetical protein
MIPSTCIRQREVTYPCWDQGNFRYSHLEARQKFIFPYDNHSPFTTIDRYLIRNRITSVLVSPSLQNLNISSTVSSRGLLVILLQNYTETDSRRHRLESSPPWKPRILHQLYWCIDCIDVLSKVNNVVSTPWRCVHYLIKYNASKAYWAVEVQVHALTSALDGDAWSASRLGRFTPREWAPGTYCTHN